MKRFAAWATGWWERFASRATKTLFSREILQAQKRFISDVAHELRTPLSVIKTSAEVALIDPGVPRDARASFEEIIGELERISGILDNLLSLGALGRPERMLFKSVDIGAVAEVVVARYRPLARERSLRVRLRARPGSLAWVNASAVEQILGNLVKNAILYTPKGGEPVVLTIAPEPSAAPGAVPQVLMQIDDHGVGIAPKDLGHVFDPFYRADLSRTRLSTKTGSGLGLTIVGELVRAMSGTIAIESRRAKGTTVFVRLPAGSLRPGGHSSAVQAAPATLQSMQEGTAIWSPIRAAVTFLRGW